MARIIYKDGYSNINQLKCIEGVEIDLLNGQKALIYPKYEKCKLLQKDESGGYGGYCFMSEIEALKAQPCDARDNTFSLYELGSPAARHVCYFTSDKHGSFYLPTLLAAMEICDQCTQIDELAKSIKGADLLFTSYNSVWSSCRCTNDLAWYYNNYGGFISSYYFYNENLAVPCVLYNC
jgi:hypothetical protein